MALDGYAKRKLFFPTELLHGLYDGGHGAGLEDYWEKIWNHPQGTGGFLWVFADEGIARTDRNGAIDLDGNHAPDGIVGPRNEKEASFYTIKKVWSPVFIEKRYITPEFNGTFRLENRYHFTNLSACTITAEWVKLNVSGEQVAIHKEEVPFSLAPGKRGTLQLQLPEDWGQNHLLRLQVVDHKGEKVDTWSYPIRDASDMIGDFITKKTGNEITQKEIGNTIQVAVQGITYSFDKQKGTLKEVLNNTTIIPLSEGPTFASREQQADVVTTGFNAQGEWVMKVLMKTEDSFEWRIDKAGLLHLNVAYTPAKEASFAGITFRYPEENVTGAKWLGDGPQRVWKNRMQGTQFGVWSKENNNTITGHSNLGYPEFKGYHSNLYWMQLQTKNNTGFKVYTTSDDLFLHLFTPAQPEDARFAQGVFPKGDISFLHGIAPIGTKFNATDELGPQSASYQFNANNFFGGRITMELIFDFKN